MNNLTSRSEYDVLTKTTMLSHLTWLWTDIEKYISDREGKLDEKFLKKAKAKICTIHDVEFFLEKIWTRLEIETLRNKNLAMKNILLMGKIEKMDKEIINLKSNIK